MRDALLLAASLLSSTCGMAWLALGMNVHWQQVFGDGTISPTMSRRLRAMGAAALFGSLVLCLSADHPSIAVLVWVMQLAASTLIVAFTLAWRAQWLGLFAPWVRRQPIR